MRTYLVMLLAASLAGCAADIRKDDSMSPLSTYADTRNRLLANIEGDPALTARADWPRLAGAWRRALQAAASDADYQLSAGNASAAGAPAATVLTVEVARLQPAGPPGDGLGEALLRVDVRFADGPSGRLLGSRRYESASDEPESLQRQIDAISREIIGELQNAQRIAKRAPLPPAAPATPAAVAPRSEPAAAPAPAPAPGQSLAAETPLDKPLVAHDSREQQLQKLQQSGLPFEQYQSEYRRLTAQ